MRFLLKLIASALAILLADYFMDSVYVNTPYTALLLAIVLSFFNSVLKPIMIILTIPVTIASFGLFLIIINGLLVLAADWLIDGFRVNGLLNAVLFSIVLWLFSMITETLLKPRKEK